MNKIDKLSEEDIITYQQLYNFYVLEGHTQKECCEYFNTNHHVISKLVKKWHLIGELNQRKQDHLVRNKEWVPPLELEDIERVYMNTSISGKDAAKMLGTSFSTFRRCLTYYNLHKDPQLIRQNIQEVWNKKYQNGHPLRDLTVQEKVQNTCQKKYGVTNVFQDPAIQEQIKRTLIEKYGVDNPLKSSEIQNKIKQNNMIKYGVEHLAQIQIQHYEIWNSINNMQQWLLEHKNNKLNLFDVANYFNVDYTSAVRKIKQFNLEEYVVWDLPRSHYEDEIIQILQENFHVQNIEKNKRGLLPSGREIDIYLPDYKLGIEFNGEYWHCDIQEKFQDHNGRSVYHQQKSLEAEAQGIFLFHIFEHEWSEDWISKNPKFMNMRSNIINRLQSILVQVQKKIPARKCEIKEISIKTKNEFLNKNHIQGADRAGSYSLGLFYHNQLVSCMCFGHSKYDKYDYELTRFANLHNTIIQGGASKLFKYFVKHKMKTNENIVSYNDITKTKGDLYKILGFECVSINNPNYWWVNLDTYDVRSRYQEQEAGETERMHANGYYRISDCGTKTWLYTKK